ncbi:hypothetical protein B0J17DRAFT_121022 [Rhizoctonia solani]|nr:hypothetical protein B0J17DRAFT_121022 [Rhizoctonia solani]
MLPYFTSCHHGSILITTRLADRSGLAKPSSSVHHVSSIHPKDASSLLLRVVNIRAPYEPEATNDQSAADALVYDFGHLALAIVQAGAYIAHLPGMTIPIYHKRFREKQREMLEKYTTLPESSKFDNYTKTVYTTWNMCYELLEQRQKPEAQKLLWLIAFLHHSGITMPMFQRAVANIRHYVPVLEQMEMEKDAHRYLYMYLLGSEDPNVEEDWVENSFIETIASLLHSH